MSDNCENVGLFFGRGEKKIIWKINCALLHVFETDTLYVFVCDIQIFRYTHAQQP